MRTGPLERAIDHYKVQGKWGWSWVFGRVFLGYLNAHRQTFSGYGLIIPSPTYTGDGGRPFDHTAMVVEQAQKEDESDAWPFAIGVVRKTTATTPFRGRTWPQRHTIATSQLRQALTVPNPALVKDQRVLVFDDVFTEGLTLLEVARALRVAGATEVSQIVLARQPWGRR